MVSGFPSVVGNVTTAVMAVMERRILRGVICGTAGAQFSATATGWAIRTTLIGCQGVKTQREGAMRIPVSCLTAIRFVIKTQANFPHGEREKEEA